MRNIAYMRVSTEEQVNSGLGIEAQEAAIRKGLGKEPDHIFMDKGVSGGRADRKGLSDAIDSLRKGDVLVVAKRDRLSRDMFLSCWIEKEVKKRGARIVSVSGEGTECDDPASVLMRRIVDSFAEYERLLIGQRTKVALAEKRKRGEKTGGDVPYGYKLINGKLAEHKSEQKAIKLIKKLQGKRYSLRAICKELEKVKHRTKTGKTKWNPKTISCILKRVA